MNRVFVLSFIMLLSCELNTKYVNREEDIKKAENVMDLYFQNIQNQEYIKNKNLLAKTFYSKVSYEQWEDVIKKMDKDGGTIQDYQLIESNSQVLQGTNSKQKFRMKYRVKRKGFDITEIFELRNENDSIKIQYITMEE